MEIKYSTENNGETYLKIQVGSQTYTLRGYSRAGLRTCISIDELNVVFDMGYAMERAFSYDNKLISHGHTDHIGGLHIDHCARKLNNINKQKLIVMPKQCIKPFKIIASAVSEMNSGKLGENVKFLDTLVLTNLIESEFCELNLLNLIGNGKSNSEYWVKSFQMDHKIKSFGYVIYRKSQKLKPEYLHLKPHEIVQIKKTIGEKNITTEVYTPLVGYTGDTTITGVLAYEEFLTVPLLIIECTGFASEDNCTCCEGKHIHINDLVMHENLFQNQHIVLFHFSQQYRYLEQILSYCTHIPPSLSSRLSYFF